MSRARVPILGAAVLLLLVVGGYLVLGPGRGAREDINDQKQIVGAQLATIRGQLELQRQQLDVARQQLEIGRETRDIAKDTLAQTAALRSLTAQALEVARGTESKTGELVSLTRELLALIRAIKAIALETEQHVENIDRKTGPTPTPR